MRLPDKSSRDPEFVLPGSVVPELLPLFDVPVDPPGPTVDPVGVERVEESVELPVDGETTVVLPFPFLFAMETWYVRTSPFSAFT